MHSSDFFCTAEVFILAVCAYLADLQVFAVDEKRQSPLKVTAVSVFGLFKELFDLPNHNKGEDCASPC